MVCRIENGTKQDMEKGLKGAISEFFGKMAAQHDLPNISLEDIENTLLLTETDGFCGWNLSINEEGEGCNGFLEIQVPCLKVEKIKTNFSIEKEGKIYKMDVKIF